ncbi:MAG: methylmalonyl Co-A mutase-associated GTPase MeaB [Dehalococcoidia bacterium]|nr:methylmalonyl Co-A mutase-associated GTPase MeaB [Dehalococcoidia bacterium]
MLKGDRQALARLISRVEEDNPDVPHVIRQIKGHLGKAYVLGVTGIPGGGKSTLVDKLTSLLREKGFSVGIIAIDPSSPFSGGALLGDRIRMQEHYLDEGVFIRSMSTRGAHGGLPHSARSVTKLLDASGKDFIILETAGVGQTELDIMKIADTILVVLTPEVGDSIQALKAGLLEIADIFVVNKADRPGAEKLARNLQSMARPQVAKAGWEVPVLIAQALNNIGLDELWSEIEKHRHLQQETGGLNARRSGQRLQEFIEHVKLGLEAAFEGHIRSDKRISEYMRKVEQEGEDPLVAASEVLRDRKVLEEWIRKLVRG